MAPFVNDPTLPQFRLDQGEEARPTQEEYPVWYFLTGSLAKHSNLKSLLRLDQDPDFRPATVEGVSHMQLRKFNALTESRREPLWTPTGEAHGVAYLVKDEREEQAMRMFKTDFFVTLRCKIKLHSRDGRDYRSEVNGLTFVLIGSWPVLQNMSTPVISMCPGAVGSKRPSRFDWVPMNEGKKGRASSVILSAPGIALSGAEHESQSPSLRQRSRSL